MVLVNFDNKFPHKKNKINEEYDSKINQIQKAKEPKRKLSRKFYAPKKTVPHQMKKKSVIVIQKGFYSW